MQKFIGRISDSTIRISDLENDVEKVLIKLNGPEPLTTTDEAETPCGTGDIAEVEYALSQLSMKLEYLEGRTRKLLHTLE